MFFLAVGFETTTPASCLAVRKASEDGLTNFALLVANKTMPGAYAALKGSADVFLYPGHVNAITVRNCVNHWWMKASAVLWQVLQPKNY